MINNQDKSVKITPSVKLIGGYDVTLSTINMETKEETVDQEVYAKDLLEVTFLIATHVNDENFLNGINQKRNELQTKARKIKRINYR